MQTCNIWPAAKSPNEPVEVFSPENHRSEWVLFLAMFDNTGGYSVSAHGCDQSRISLIYNFSSYFDPPSTSKHGVWYSHCFGTFTQFYGYLKVLDSSKHPQHRRNFWLFVPKTEPLKSPKNGLWRIDIPLWGFLTRSPVAGRRKGKGWKSSTLRLGDQKPYPLRSLQMKPLTKFST